MCGNTLQSMFRGKPAERAVRFSPLPQWSGSRQHFEKYASRGGIKAKKQSGDPLGGYVSEFDQRTALGG